MDLLFSFKSAKKAYNYPVTGVIKGTLPPWVNGSLYRIGPGKYEVGTDKYQHAFDGLGMIQRFYINNGQVIFNSQYVQSRAYLQNMAANRIVVSEFGTVAYPDPCRTIFNKLSIIFEKEFTDNTCVCVYPLGDEIFSATETDVIHRIDPVDLSTIGSVRLSSILSINRATAHYHIDFDTRIVHLLGFAHNPTQSYVMVSLPPIQKEDSSKLHEKYDMEKLLQKAKIVGKVSARWKLNPSYYHSFGITENYYVFLECPLTISILDLLKSKVTFKSFANAMKWWPEEKTVIHLMNRRTGEILSHKYVTDPLFTFHHINAYEDQGHIVIDYCGYNDGSIIMNMFINSAENKLPQQVLCFPRRLVVPIQIDDKSSESDNLITLEGTSCTANIISRQNKKLVIHCKQEELSEGACMELPTINYNAYNGKKYRYLYGVSNNRLIKVDTVTKKDIFWSSIKDSIVCESIFVKNPDADDNNSNDEDYGILLSPVLIKDENIETERYQSLVIIDAKSMKELGRAEFESVSIPFTFHGLFESVN